MNSSLWSDNQDYSGILSEAAVPKVRDVKIPGIIRWFRLQIVQVCQNCVLGLVFSDWSSRWRCSGHCLLFKFQVRV